MLIQVGFDLPFRFGKVTQTGSTTQPACEEATQEGSGIPERIESADSSAERLEPAFAPEEMPLLLRCGIAEHLCEFRIGRCGKRLPAIEGLCRHFARMVDPEIAPTAPHRSGVQNPIVRIPLRRPRCRPEGSERMVTLDEEALSE